MQQETDSNTLKLILDVMDNDDIPVQPDLPFAFKTGELSALYAGWNIVKYNENVGALHRVDADGKWIKQYFATLLGQRI